MALQPTPPAAPKRVFRVFCDESGQTGCHFMVIGGVVVFPDATNEISAAFQAVRAKYGMVRELKWGKVSTAKLQAYKEFLGVLRAHRSVMHYKAIIVDMTKVDLAYHEGDAELGFYKFYWQLLYHKFGRQYVQTEADSLHITLDYRPSLYPLGKLKSILNSAFFSKRDLVSPVKSVEPMCSKKSDFLQLADIATGAIGYHCNDHDKAANASPAKTELAELVRKLAEVTRLNRQTRYGKQDLEIWPLSFGYKK